MRNNALFLLIIQLAFFSTIWSNRVVAGNIVYPWRAAPAMVQAGERLCIWYDDIEAAGIDSVHLSGPFFQTRLAIDSLCIGRHEYDPYTHAAINCRLWVRIPANTPEDLYDLKVFGRDEVDDSKRSLKVLARFKPAHCFIHISDLHVSRQWVGTAEHGYAKELELLDAFIKVANLIAADFIIITGDVIHHYTSFDADSTGWGGRKVYSADQRPIVEEKYSNLFNGANGLAGLLGLNSPVFLLPGNHDYYGVVQNDYPRKAEQWNRLCGRRVYGFSYAGTRVLAADDFLGDPIVDVPNQAPMSGLQGQTLRNFFKENGVGCLRIMAQHRPDRIDTAFIDQYKINILLNGHRHDPATEWVGATPTLSARPGTVCRSGEIGRWETTLGFFRVFYLNEDSFTFTPPLRFCQNPTAPINELKLNLTLDFCRPNDGSSRQNKGLLVNNLAVDLPHCRIRFIMKRGAYTIDRGFIEQVMHTDKATIVDVRVPVKANARETVAIAGTE